MLILPKYRNFCMECMQCVNWISEGDLKVLDILDRNIVSRGKKIDMYERNRHTSAWASTEVPSGPCTRILMFCIILASSSSEPSSDSWSEGSSIEAVASGRWEGSTDIPKRRQFSCEGEVDGKVNCVLCSYYNDSASSYGAALRHWPHNISMAKHIYNNFWYYTQQWEDITSLNAPELTPNRWKTNRSCPFLLHVWIHAAFMRNWGNMNIKAWTFFWNQLSPPPQNSPFPSSPSLTIQWPFQTITHVPSKEVLLIRTNGDMRWL